MGKRKNTDVREKLLQKVKLRKKISSELEKMKTEVDHHFDNFKKNIKQESK